MNKITLHHVDIIMSYRENSAERRENLYAVLRYFDRTFTDYTIYLSEADAEPKFDWKALSDPKIQHIFICNTGPFPKALLYNIGVKASRGKILYFNDVDCIPHPRVLTDCINNIASTQENGVLCPYYGAINITGETKKRFMDTPDFSILDGISKTNLTEDSSVLYETSMGASFIFRRTDFARIGGLDPSFVGWGSEDNELFYRSKRLGINWVSMNTPLFHLHHGNTTREEWKKQEAQENSRKALESDTMPIEDLEARAQRLSEFFK